MGDASLFTSPKRLKTLSIFSMISLRNSRFFTSSRRFGNVSESVGKNFWSRPTCSVRFFILIKEAFSSRKFSISISFSSLSMSSYSLKGIAFALSKLVRNSAVFFRESSASEISRGSIFSMFCAVFGEKAKGAISARSCGNSSSIKSSLLMCTAQK